MDVKYLKVNLSEGSLLTAEGYAIRQDVNVTTKASFSAFRLESDEVNIEVGLAGIAKICANNELNAKARMRGYIGYKCNPKKRSIKDGLTGNVKDVGE
jgi:hypothetical protein